jgi:hypothetical protein
MKTAKNTNITPGAQFLNITPGVIRAVRKSKTLKFFLDNWFISIFFACIAFVALVSFYKLFVKQENFVYARVKVSQGLWWASTQRPPQWLAAALNESMVEKDLTGKPKAKILSMRSYPYYTTGYEVYLTLKLKVSGKLKTGTVNFNRSTLAVGSPIELAFPKAEITGTVIEMSEKPIKDKLVWKEITLIKSNAYQWEYDAIKIGDVYNDGKEKVFEVLDKQLSPNSSLGFEPYGSYSERSLVSPLTESRYIITVKAKIKARQSFSDLIYGAEQELKIGKTINLSTQNFYFQDFRLAGIE